MDAKGCDPRPTRAGFAIPGDREWAAVEHSDGVYFAESASERVGPFPAEGAQRQAVRQNEYELVIALARATAEGSAEGSLDERATQHRFSGTFDPLLAAALSELHRRGEYDEQARTERGPVALIDRFLLLDEADGVEVREYDAPEEALSNFEVLCEEG